MPVYRSIDIALHSQFDIEPLPEYHPAPKEDYIARGITGFIPDLVDDTTSTCSVYIPVLPGSTFWIGYSVSPPVPDSHFFLFKLYVNGAHLVSWSTGKDEDWKGKTMFGLFESTAGGDGRKRIEKRVFCFTPPDRKDGEWKDVVDVFDQTARIEVRVHRASGRKRIERKMLQYKETQHAKDSRGISLVDAGRAGPDQPKRQFKLALIDPVDQPFVTFRYYYRTWDQLQTLGLLGQCWSEAGEEDGLSVIEPYAGDVAALRSCTDITADEQAETEVNEARENENEEQSQGDHNAGHSQARRPCTPGAVLRQTSVKSDQARAYVPRGAPQVCTTGKQEDEEMHENTHTRTPPQSVRLSVPPSVRLIPPQTAPWPLSRIPHKSDSSSSTAYRPHPAYPVEDWTVLTPSPVKQIRFDISTPPLEKRAQQSRSASSLMAFISSTWRRRGTQLADESKTVDAETGARSTSR